MLDQQACSKKFNTILFLRLLQHTLTFQLYTSQQKG